MINIVVLDGYALNPGDMSWEGLKKLGNLSVYDRTPPDMIIERSENATAIFTNKVILTRKIISELPKLKYIGVLATGYNIVDTVAARDAGVVVTNIPAYSTESVAQLVFSHILNFVNNVGIHAQSVRNGEWENNSDFSYRKTPQIELADKILGIIGFGKIGQAVAKIGHAFGMKVCFYNPSIKENIPDYCVQVDQDTLLSKADFLSINCPLTDTNKGFVNADFLKKMKPEAFLINTGRGQLIVEQDLADALNKGWIAGAGLDVLSFEPPTKNNPLVMARNCWITPHIAWTTREARLRLMTIAASNLDAFLKGNPVHVVN